VIRQDPNRIREQAAWHLLQRFRDLNLADGVVNLSGGEKVRIKGCTSLDHPVERGVRYSLSYEDGKTGIVELEWRDGRIHTNRSKGPAIDHPCGTSFGLNGHPMGLVEISSLRAAIDLSSASSEDFEVLLGRIVEATLEVA